MEGYVSRGTATSSGSVLEMEFIMSLDWRTLNWLETRVDELIDRGMTELEAINLALEESEQWD